MNIRLECFSGEKDAAVAALSECFNIRSVSDPYPNARQTGSPGTPCENRYYIRLGDQPMKNGQSLTEKMVADMMRYLGTLAKAFGMPLDPELAKLRQFYLSSAGFTDTQKFELLAEWKASLLSRFIGQEKGGSANAAGNH